MRLALFLLSLMPAVAQAGVFDRPVPQAQSATAEFWFASSAILFCLALYAVHRLVARR
ncbi:protein NnrT [Hoeflea olei]|uniref:Protein NnrT n=1 Tax=Hoeflea olei TaxID=1480615 RepID=A0A1C1YSJ7_9HYPH|nr:protein NnrT [Hoeflea olei]OCW56327.1 protein NnrT [Hoeflea olei]